MYDESPAFSFVWHWQPSAPCFPLPEWQHYAWPFVEDLFQPDQPQLVICPSILTGFNPPVAWQPILIPGSLVPLPLEDDHWWKCPASSIDSFNNSHPFCVPRLYKLWTEDSLRPSNNLGCSNNPHLGSMLIKIVYILLHNPIFLNDVLYELEPLWIILGSSHKAL
ncbi:hypothetical protein I7I48_11459 [Histoplasma ohiense]|nr:hypothetical protein I7I48_11459 [Histoplasma ohiense (nom. inval.)]